MFVSEEKHEGDWVIEFIHLLEVWDLVEIADVDDGEVLNTISDTWEELVGVNGEVNGESYDRGLHLVACSRGPSRDQSG
jgi:hypothetical protein